ncbi:MAG: hypothetical protein RL333_106 [Pseudomonadota bacterium]
MLKLLILSLALTACSSHSLQVQRDFDARFDFKAIKTFDLSEGTLETEAAKTTAERIQLNALVDAKIKSALEARGYRQSSNHPDIQIAYSFGEWALDSHKKPNGGYGAVNIMFPGAHGSLLPTSADGRVPPPSEDPYTSKYEEAKLEVLAIDPVSRKIVWNAGVTDKTDFGYFRSSQKERIEQAVTAILEGFPPGSGKAP